MGEGNALLIIANWKMNMTRRGIVAYLDRLSREDRWTVWRENGYHLALSPPAVYLDFLVSECRIREFPFRVLAQNVSSFENGAFTGEISVDMLKDIGVEGVLLGHSERRRYFGETDKTVAEKTSLTLSRELLPVVCFGENEEERRAGSCSRVWDGQVRPVWEAVLEAKKRGHAPFVFWAYEPVWAIGTGKTADLGDIREVSAYLREKFGPECAEGLLYGGSVTDESVSSQFEKGTVHGFLVGSAFLDPECVVRTFDRLLPNPVNASCSDSGMGVGFDQ